jgi:hypothetical protein
MPDPGSYTYYEYLGGGRYSDPVHVPGEPVTWAAGWPERSEGACTMPEKSTLTAEQTLALFRIELEHRVTKVSEVIADRTAAPDLVMCSAALRAELRNLIKILDNYYHPEA